MKLKTLPFAVLMMVLLATHLASAQSNLPPFILSQPQSVLTTNGATVTFNVGVSNSAPGGLGYQWQFSGTNLAYYYGNQTVYSPSLILTRVTNSNAGPYRVVVTNKWGSVTSSVATLAFAILPSITNQPTGQVASNLDENVMFSVGAMGTGPLTYQWLLNGKIITNNLITTVAGNGLGGSNGNNFGDGGLATNASLSQPTGVAVDAEGNLFIADKYDNRIRKVNPGGIITTVVGASGGGYNGNGLVATNSTLDWPTGVALDGDENLYVADSDNERVRVETYGFLITVAGTGGAGFAGDGGGALNAGLDVPSGVAVDASGNIYIADTYNQRVRKVDLNDNITTVAGSGPNKPLGDGGAATNAGLNEPYGIAVDAPGNVYIADMGDNRIRKVGTNGIITTVAGNGYENYSGDGLAATNASINRPSGVAVDAYGQIFIADMFNNRIRKVGVSGLITTVAGGFNSKPPGDGGAATNASLNEPAGVTLDPYGNIYIADTANNRVRKVTPQGPSLTVAGAGWTNAGNYQVIVSSPYGSITSSLAALTVDLPPLITQQPANQSVPSGGTIVFKTAALGTAPLAYQWQFNGTNLADGGGVSGSATTNLTLTQVTTNRAGPYAVIVTDVFGSTTSSVAALTVTLPPAITSQPAAQSIVYGQNTTFSVGVAGTGPFTYQWQLNGVNLFPGGTISAFAGNLGRGLTYFGDGGAATNAGLSLPYAVAFDGTGNLYIADYDDNVIRKVDGGGIITTVAGNFSLGAGYGGDGGAATNALLNHPKGIALDSSGDLFIADSDNNVIREMNSNGIITTVAGNYSLGAGDTGDGGTATNATLNSPIGVAVDSAGELYIADYNNNVIRLVGTNGLITRVAGNGSVPAGYSGDGGQATGALLNGPAAVAVDGAGNFYIADYQNSVIRQVDGNGLIRTVAGNYALGGSFSGDGGAATNAGLYKPNDLILDGAGNIYIADSDNSVVRKVDEKGMITTVVGGYNGRGSYAGDGGAATNAGLDLVEGVALDGSGNLYIADYYNNLIRRVSMTYTNFTYTNGALMITDAQPTNAGLYDVIITGVGGSVTSSVAPLIIVYPPAIASQPASQTVINGGTAAFAVAATGTDPFSYQWQFDGTNLTDGGDLFGSATTNLVVGGATAADAGQYDVIITNAWGSVTSSVVVLNIAYPPAITNQPVSQTIINGSNAVFSVGAAGTDALGYQWQFNGVNLTDGGNISGSVTPILTLTPAMGANAGGYDAIITNAWGSITSSVAALTIVYPPAITNQPVSESVVVGVVASLAVTATGTGPLSYQWQFNGMDLTDGAGISGSATTNLVLTPANANEAGAYDVVIANAWGSVTSSVAALTITYPPSITNEPVSQTVVNLSRTTFTVAATGTAPLAYQWQFNGVNLLVNNTVSGTTTPTLVLAQVTAANTGNYDVVVANAWGSVTSSVAALTIVYAPAITQQPTNQLLLAGGNANFGAVASGTPPLFYQWQFNGTNLSDGGYFSGSATTNLLVTQVTAANAGNYDIVITNAWGSVTSSIASLTIASPPIITLQPTNESVIVGANGSFQVLAAGTLPLHFQWLINGGAITNRNVQSANTDRLFFDPVQTTNAGTYEVVITNAWGSVTSSVASLTVLVPPTITSQPSNQTAAVSTAVTFSVGVSGTGPFTYQWTYNQRDLPVTLITTIAGTNGSGYSGDGGAATNARLNEPAGLALDGAGSVFIADQKNERIRKINAAGIITTVAGNGNLGYSGNGLAATNSPLSSPAGVAVDAEDNLFIADSNNQRVRTVTFNIMLSIAGDGVGGYSGDGGAAYNAKLYLPSGVAVDADGNIYIADTDNHCIRKVDINDTITTVAGTGKKGFSGDGGAATNASLFLPGAVAVDGAGNLFIADTGNERIRKMDANGIITTVAGKGSQGYNGDGGAATNATFGNPAGVAVDTSGNFYVADTYNDRIRKVNSNGIITTVAGHGTAGFGGDGGAATNALLAQPAGVAVDGHGNLFIADTGNSRIREVTTQGPVLSFTAATTNAGSYSVIITGPGGTVTSTVAVLTVVYPPSIVQTPASQTVIEGATVQLGVSVSGSDPFYYHWQFNGTNLANGGQITGAMASTLTLTQVTTNNAGRYAVIVTNTFGSVTSSIVTLTVNLPQISVISATNGGVTLNFLTAANVSSRVLTATNLIPPAVWVSIYTNRPGTNGFWQFTDTNNSLFPERFYRTSTP